MRTATLQSVLLRSWQRAGNDAAGTGMFSAQVLPTIVAAANDAIQSCWEFADWPELMRQDYRSLSADSDGLYLSTEGIVDGGAVSSYAPMGEVMGVFQDNPTSSSAPREISYGLLGDNVRIFGNRFAASVANADPSLPPVNYVYVRYRLRPTEYVTGDLLAAVPYVLSKAASLLITASLLNEDGQMDKAMATEGKADSELMFQRDKYIFQQGQTPGWSAVSR